MEEYITVTAKTVKDAILEASLKLETFRDNIEYEVIEEGSTGFLGFGSKKAVIKARKKVAVEDILKENKKSNLTETVFHYEEYGPLYFPIVHPSPLNFRWQNKNPWFLENVVPKLKIRVSEILDK